MASKDDDEITAVVAGVLAGIALAVVGVVYAVGGGKTMRAPAASSLEMVDMAPIGEPRAKVYFGVGKAELNEADGAVVATTVQALANKPQAIVLLSGFHDPSGDAAANARLARARAVSVRTALLASGVDASRVQANLLLTLVALIWVSAFIAQSHGMADSGPLAFTGARFLIGALVVTPLSWREWQGLQRPDGRAQGRRQVWQIGGLGVRLLLGAVTQQTGLISTTVTNAGFLPALYVPLVPLPGWLVLRQLPHWSVWPTGLSCLLGAFLLSGAHELSIGIGELWVIASALHWALHMLLVGRVVDRQGAPFLVAGGQFFVCALLALAGALLFERVDRAALRAAALPIL